MYIEYDPQSAIRNLLCTYSDDVMSDERMCSAVQSVGVIMQFYMHAVRKVSGRQIYIFVSFALGSYGAPIRSFMLHYSDICHTLAREARAS